MRSQYLSSMPIYYEAAIRLSELKEKKQQIEKRLSKYPPGKIHVVIDKGRIKYYFRIDPSDKSGTYMPKKEMKKIKLYLQKKYDEEAIKLVNSEIKRLEKFLKKSDFIIEKIRDVFSDNPQKIKELISPIDVSDKDYIEGWLAIPYVKKEIRDDKSDYRSDKGDVVRSKSELNIANYLYKMNIPYKYECPLILEDGLKIYPDFTILDIRRRREVYWEHRGMMDDIAYACSSVERIKMYEKSNLFLGDSLIITEETLNQHLGTWEIQSVIQHYFC